MMKTFIIAEVATTWLTPDWNDFAGLAKQCAVCGVQAVKTQWVSDPRRMEQRRKMPPFTYSYLNWPQTWMNDMAQLCTDNGVEFMCTSFLKQDIAVIAPFVNRFKVASLEAGDATFVNAHYDYEQLHRPRNTLISCGAMSYDEVHHLQSEVLLRYPRWMQCVCSYPARVEQLNLSCGDLISRRLFQGLSDHTANLLTGALAVAAGYSIIEVHVRHPMTLPHNPDYAHSLTVADLKSYVDNVRLAERALGDGIKKVETCEEPLREHRVIT